MWQSNLTHNDTTKILYAFLINGNVILVLSMTVIIHLGIIKDVAWIFDYSVK
jgi:hypothetical protein